MNSEFDFSEALTLLRKGKSLCRKGWNGKNLCVFFYKPDSEIHKPYFQIWNKEINTIHPWVPSISDILALDWTTTDDK